MEIIVTLVLGSLLLIWGMRFGRVLVRSGVTANDLFKGRNSIALLFLGFYIGLLLLALNLPQMPALPIEWRVHGMRVTWTLLRVMLMGVCGIGLTVSWLTARSQVIAVILIGCLGLGGFTSAEAYFMAPIYADLIDNLRPNGVFKQTSNSSCAPAALATVLRKWGMDATESSVARLAGTSRLGTSMPQLIIAARALGMQGIELSPNWEQIQQINRPGILAVWLFNGPRKLPHAVALLGINNNIATIADPSRGRIFYLDRPTFAKIWREQYVPIFRSADILLSDKQAINYLSKLGYNSGNLPADIERFQKDKNLKPSGKLDRMTELMLSGPFLEGVPRLDGK
ncbi:cysteine peptidase family C39 domain-containing protein [Tychonema sp. BBK16]|uniref:cysteine peptidase family C39 domain-containing protein n=1 Tax=Tychonema sp. BBK16 TaxID=2699888 RepID=UPI001F2D2D9C|nr:cysteine peptidase family C39 domain-containing protein [Tychonema sp. BBK16]MCF6374196.1 cysteine peptidase family C39 domain-containing protein [Tychonema sp. BBK16]